MWNAADLLTDLDLLALDRTCLSEFGVPDLTTKRQVASAWIAQRVEAAGYRLQQHEVRKAPDAVWGVVGTDYTDYTAAALSSTDVDVPLSSILAVPSVSALCLGYRAPFRGAYVGAIDSVNANSCVLTAQVWTGGWSYVNSLQDGTQATASVPLSGGGFLAWQYPDTWVTRSLNGSARLYWARFAVNNSLTRGTSAGQLTPVVASRLTLPASQYTLGLLYQESYGSNRGQWQEKSDRLFAAAEQSLGVALPLIADEFDVSGDAAVSGQEASSVVPAGQYASWERG